MGAFTQLGVAELADLAATFSLGHISSHYAIAAGTINSNFSVTTDRARWFVRVNEGKAEDDVAWEARLVAALAAGGVTTPAPLVALDGRPYAPLGKKFVSVFPWKAGTHLTPIEVTPGLAGRLGAALAQLHTVGLELAASWRRPSIYAHDYLVARFTGFANNRDPELAQAIAILGEELQVAAAAAEIRRGATQGIIHGDLFRDNVLWQGGKITAILDFEQASSGSLAYDLGVAINDWCWSDSPDIGLVRALLAGYKSVRELTAGDRAALPIEVRAAAARFTITRITDVYLAEVENPEKDFRAFLARSEAWRGPVLGQVSAVL